MPIKELKLEEFSEEVRGLIRKLEQGQQLDFLENKSLNRALIEEKQKHRPNKHEEKLKKEYTEKYKQTLKYINERLSMEDIEQIRCLFNLSKVWDIPLCSYILTDKMTKPNFDPKIHFFNRTPYKENYSLKIEIFGNSSLADIQKIWTSKIKPKLNKLPDYKFRNAKYKTSLEYGEIAEVLHQKGFKGKKLTSEVDKKFAHLKNKLTEESIRKSRERARKKRDSRTR